MKNVILQKFPLGFPWPTQDPFLFCAYHLDYYPKGNGMMGPDPKLLEGRNIGSDFTLKDGWRMYHGSTIPGFPYHPHRGFETITLVNKGFCDHSDSLGAAGRFGEGDVQWMTAGRGVQHAEMFPLLRDNHGNTLELFQIWLNLPKANKFVEPHFKMLWHEDIPLVEEDHATIKVIAGSYKGHQAPSPAPNSWAAVPDHQVAIWNIHLDAKADFTLPASEYGVQRTLYFYEGDYLFLGESKVNAGFGIQIDATKDTELRIGSKNAGVLLLQGKPINEPIAQQGPFVMNTRDELHQAFEEYRLTQFGGWPWPYPDHVHDKEKGRFAKYPNGTLELK